MGMDSATPMKSASCSWHEICCAFWAQGREKMEQTAKITKGELRKLRKAAHAKGHNYDADVQAVQADIRARAKAQKAADRATQQGRYIDCGPGAWDDRD